MKIGLQPLKQKSLEQSVIYIEKEVDRGEEELVLYIDIEDVKSNLVAETINHSFIEKSHKESGHKLESNMMQALLQAEVVTPDTRKVVKNATKSCQECKKFEKSLPKPKTTLPKVCDTNQIIMWDLKDWHNKFWIMWMIDSFSHFVKCVVINNKHKDTILKVMYYDWCCHLGCQGFKV